MKLFPIHSQTSDADKTVLLKIKELLQEHGQYNYAEIGSYLGGSLTPFLADNDCVSILSIDERERQQPDERGAKYDYSGITHDTMLNNLRNHGFDTTKIEVFDGSVNEYTPNKTYDFIFIDGEHTDWACFRDFIHAERLCKQDCIVAFHDTSLVYKAIKIINELLIASGVKFKLVKVKDSEMTCIFF
ncbi:MAG: class I SAM-dependent methyltransferase, partial [Bacteroidia bacterium]